MGTGHVLIIQICHPNAIEKKWKQNSRENGHFIMGRFMLTRINRVGMGLAQLIQYKTTALKWSDLRKVASLPGSAHASIVSHKSPNDSIQSHQAKRALVHRASSLEAPHHLELCHSVPDQVKG